MASDASLHDSRRSPTAEPLAVRAARPIGHLPGMALRAKLITVIEGNRLTTQSVERVGFRGQVMA